MTASALRAKSVFIIGWLFGVSHFVVGLNWIAKAFTFQSAMPEWLGYLAVILLALYLAIYPALASLATWGLAKDRPVAFVIAFAAFWIITEWLRSWMFSGFIWNPLGVAMLPVGNLSLASQYIGTYGLSGLVLLVAGGLWLLFSAFRKAGAFILIGVTTLALVPAAGPGPFKPKKTSLVTIVQPNIGQQDKWKAGYEAENLAKLAELTVREDEAPRIIFWPEAAIPDYLETGYPQRYYYGRSPELVRGQLAELMKPGDILVLGGLKLEFDDKNQKAIGARNSIFAMNSDRKLIGRYDKNHLVPYGEYLPMRPLLSAIGLSRLAPGDFDFWPGPGPRSLDLGSFGKVGLQVCYEIIFSGQVVDRDNRPSFIFNPSNDAWFGRWGPPQHLAQARLRAIEEGLPVIRSTPTGISAIVDANGLVMDSVPMGVAGRIDSVLPPALSPTAFARFGNYLPLGFAVILLICAIAIRARAR